MHELRSGSDVATAWCDFRLPDKKQVVEGVVKSNLNNATLQLDSIHAREEAIAKAVIRTRFDLLLVFLNRLRASNVQYLSLKGF